MAVGDQCIGIIDQCRPCGVIWSLSFVSQRINVWKLFSCPNLSVCLFVFYSTGGMLVVSPAHIIYSSTIPILLPV